MWGENILVAPVLEKVAIRKYYLPEGSWWYVKPGNIFSSVTGGKWITDSVSLVSIPFFISEGAFIPLKENLSNNISKL